MAKPPPVNKINKLLFALAMCIIAIGIVLRIVVLIHNRSLIIDEANIARNIYERDFAQLLLPLSYLQYAPPIFLWAVKLSSMLLGFSEPALRLYPFLAGVGALVVLYAILKQLTSLRALWYPLFTFAVGLIFLRYSTELKQYMSDVLVVLSLLLLTLKLPLPGTGAFKFIAIWVLAGSIAIWASMPAVFMLAAIGFYYIYNIAREKKWGNMASLGLVAAIWLAQFLYYYLTILKPQADSGYLQNFHATYFINVTPDDLAGWQHNWDLVFEFVMMSGNYMGIAVAFHVLLLLAGLLVLFKKRKTEGLLLTIPIVLAFVASAFHQFSLIPRVALFIVPLLLIIIGYGFELMMNVRFRLWQIIMVIVAIVSVASQHTYKMIYKPSDPEDIKKAFSFLQQEHIEGGQLYVHEGAVPALIYYTQIDPATDWKQFGNAHLLSGTTDYDSLSANISGRSAFLFTSLPAGEPDNALHRLNTYLHLLNKQESPAEKYYVYIYNK